MKQIKELLKTNLSKKAAIALTSAAAFAYSLGISGCDQMSERSKKSEVSLDEATEKMLNTSSFEMKQVPISWGNRFNVYVDGEMVGVVDQKVWNWGMRFDIYAGNERKHLGYADQKLMHLGLVADVYNEQTEKVGALDQKLANWTTTIELQNGRNTTLAVSKKKFMSVPWRANVYAPNKITEYGEATKTLFWDNYTVKMNVKPEGLSNLTLFAWIAMEDKLHENHSRSSSKSDLLDSYKQRKNSLKENKIKLQYNNRGYYNPKF